MDEASSLQPVPYRSLLRNRNYTLLWLGQLVSVFGDRLHQIALLVLVSALTANDLGQIGLVIATIGLPSLLFGLFAGALVDRWKRRNVMLISDLIRVVLVASIPSLARIDIAWVYIITFLLTTVSLFFRPAKDAIMPDIVPEHGLLAANSLSSATDTTMEVLGYPLAGALVGGLMGSLAGGVGIDLAFYIDAGTYLFSAVMIYHMSVPNVRSAQGQASLKNLVRMVTSGLRFVRSSAPLLTNTLLIALGALVASGSLTLAYGYATEVANSGAFGYSILEAALGLGNVVGALWIGRWGGRYPKGRLILIGLIVLGLTNTFLALSPDMWFATAMMAGAGVANMLFFIPSVTLVQQLTPDEFRGRVLSFRSPMIMVSFIVSNVLLGLGAKLYGVQPMLGLSGGLLLLVGLMAWLLPSARDAN
jgi:MFS family permease